MKLLAVFTLFVVAASRHVLFDPQLDESWENFKSTYGKRYDDREDAARRLLWEQNIADIIQHNLKADLGQYSFHRGINEYADMEHQEFISAMNGFRAPNTAAVNGSNWLPPINVVAPLSVDWRNKGFVTRVKDQKQCGSCWAFSTTGSLEGQHKRKTGQLVALSEQNLVDCSGPQGNKGCDGGSMGQAFEYIIGNKGIDTEQSYPYQGKELGVCKFSRASVGATCTGYVLLPPGNEASLMLAVATVGPVSVAIDSSQKSFFTYKSGVYNEPNCSPIKLNHAVLVIGYGTENGLDYWLVKNSWGPTWGNQGYIKMIRNKNNQCGIATYASFPLV